MSINLLVIFLFQPGSGSLKLTFIGELNDKMKGFYRSKYKTPDGDDCFAAVTQFEVRRPLGYLWKNTVECRGITFASYNFIIY